MDNLWQKDMEERFFREKLKDTAPEQLFNVTEQGEYFAYWPRNYRGAKSTLQSRNTWIGEYTEEWSRKLIEEVVQDDKLYVVRKAVCKELALTKQSEGDVVISKSDGVEQRPEDILVIFEVKMSIVWNWQYIQPDRLECVGDYKTHSGKPGLLRSDSMLKAIGKSANIRSSSERACQIPIIILGNTPISKGYYDKVDTLYKSGFVQGFWSVNPNPLDNNSEENIKSTSKGGFFRFDNIDELREKINLLLNEEIIFFSSMKSKTELGKIIERANREDTYEKKGELFIKLIGE